MNSKIKITSRTTSHSGVEPGFTPSAQPGCAGGSHTCSRITSGGTSRKSRYAVIRKNLRDAIAFLAEQDRQLAFAGHLLDELRAMAGHRATQDPLRVQILLRGLADIFSAQYKKVSLFIFNSHLKLF